jgi:hypothetical protein
MEYLVYEYGCLQPVKGREHALQQMLRRHRLWNLLVEVERAYRADFLAILRDETSEQELNEARDRLAALRLEIKTRRRAERKRGVDVGDLQEPIAQAKAEVSAAIAAAREGRRARIAQHKHALELIETARRASVKQAQAASDLYWCNYDDVIANYATARRRALREGRELRFQGWDGTGKVTVRYQQGLPAGEVQGADRRLQFDPVNPLAWTSASRSERRKLARSRVRIRVGSQGRDPVWLELPVGLHRPLPEDCTVRSASVICEKVGSRERWRLLVTVARPERIARQGPAMALDLGWRLLPEGLRVGYWEDEVGAHGQLLLEPAVLWQFSKLNDLKSIQDQHLRVALAAVGEWSKTHELSAGTDLSRIDLSHIGEWRKPWRLLRLYRAWKDGRVAGDEEAFGALVAWKERYDHLHEWEANLRDQVIRHRKEVYRRFVSGLLRMHGRVFLEDLQIRSLARKDQPEEEVHNYSGSMRVVAAVSLLGRLFQEHGDCVRVSARGTTQDCSWCGHTKQWDAAENVMHRCEGCGRVFDQDQNAARNILRRGLGAGVGPVGPAAVDREETVGVVS